ncbi:MAG: hypothetical protein ACRCWJ_14980 [Casimicrobium sp.]
MSFEKQFRAEWALIDNPEKWTKRAAARDKRGVAVRATSKTAVRFCQDSARLRSYRESCARPADVYELSYVVAELFGFDGAIELNDHPDTTHADMAVFYEVLIFLGACIDEMDAA